MPEFLTTTQIASKIEETFNEAAKQIYIISPYLKLSRHVRELIEAQAANKALHIDLIYGKTDLKPEEADWLNTQRVDTHYREHLHAKCYMNEKQAVVTSMNLYEYSEKNNDEFGILLRAEDQADAAAYQQLDKAVSRLIQLSDKVTITATRGASQEPSNTKPTTNTPDKPAASIAGGLEFGYCIQNGKEIDVNPQKPLCSGCYSMNKRFNREVKGKHCHTCGKEHSSSFDKPVCPACYSKFKDVLNFAAAKR